MKMLKKSDWLLIVPVSLFCGIWLTISMVLGLGLMDGNTKDLSSIETSDLTKAKPIGIIEDRDIVLYSFEDSEKGIICYFAFPANQQVSGQDVILSCYGKETNDIK